MKYDWRAHFDHRATMFKTDFKAQVGKTVSGQSVADADLEQFASHILLKFQADRNSTLCDFGCGNGILTEYLASSFEQIYAYDFSAELIRNAKLRQKKSNIVYCELNLHEIDKSHCGDTNYFLMNEVVQHLEKAELHDILVKLYRNTGVNARLFIGGVPNEEKIKKFYDTEKKFKFYEASIDNNVPHLGTWWSTHLLSHLVKSIGWEFESFAQPEHFYSSHYRFDCMLSK